MKYKILAIIHAKSDLPKLVAFGMEFIELKDSIEAMKICDTQNDAHNFLIKRAELYNTIHFGSDVDLNLMFNEINIGCLTLDGITAYISEVEECYIIKVKKSGVELQTFDHIEDARECISSFEDVDIIEDCYTENYYEIYDSLINKIIE